MEKKERQMGTNPILYSDFPDPDIIRVDDTYYMASTTMHYMPGCDILRSYDLIHWDLLDQVYDQLEDTPRHNMQEEQNIFGEGMWAPTLRYHNGIFYLLFTANDTHSTYLFAAEAAEGPWKRILIEGFYYDSSLFFDDDGSVYIVHGQKTLHLTQLREDLSGPKEGGLERVIAVDEEKIDLGFEGSHMYKHNGKYYIFTCHILAYGTHRKSEVCFVSDSLTGEFKGKCIIDDDMGYHNLGVAQGGMVDTPQGDWYVFMFHDRGALGRAPMLMPMHWEDDFPVIGVDGKVPETVETISTRPEYQYQPLNGDDTFEASTDFQCGSGQKGENVGRNGLKRYWQFSHNPDPALWSITERNGALRIRTGKRSAGLSEARNVLTQRMTGPDCAGEITIDGSGMKDGDYAGLSAYQGCFGLIALTREAGKYYVVMIGKPAKNETIFGDFEYAVPGVEYERVPVDSPIVRLRVEADFADKKDEAEFFLKEESSAKTKHDFLDGFSRDVWKKLGITQKLYFKMDYFTGCRFGLFCYATKEIGGFADFMDFRYRNAACIRE